MKLFYNRLRDGNAPTTFVLSDTTGTGFAEDSFLLGMYLCNPPSEAVQFTTWITFWDPVTQLQHCKHARDFAVIDLEGVKLGKLFAKAMSQAVWKHEKVVPNQLWKMEVRVNYLWGAVGADHGSHVELADDVGPRGELIWRYNKEARCEFA